MHGISCAAMGGGQDRMSDGQTRILIKAGRPARERSGWAAAASAPAARRYLHSSPASNARLLSAHRKRPRWQMVEPTPKRCTLGSVPPIADRGVRASMAPRAVEFAEPDIVQRWIAEPPQRAARKLAAGCGAAEPQNPILSSRVAQGDDPWPRWHHHKNYSQFQDRFPNRDRKIDVRVAHVDTGYDPDHSTLPKFLEPHLAAQLRSRRSTELGRGSQQRPDKERRAWNRHAVDPRRRGDGLCTRPVGRTAAGRRFRWCCCEVPPSHRRSTTSTHFRDPSTFVHVVTMSMGGLASQAWADAVNALYEAGVTLVTAAGNNFGNMPTRLIVYPARFNRVIAAAGVMADFRPYTDLGLRLMAGNYGPSQKMSTTIAACTPNVPWARMGCPGHRSTATGPALRPPRHRLRLPPRLWIAKNRAAWDAYPHGWQKVEAVRSALFDSAAMTDPKGTMGDATRLGRGRLQASDALALAPRKAAQLTRTLPTQRRLRPCGCSRGWACRKRRCANRQRMLELEALQLSQSQEIESAAARWAGPATRRSGRSAPSGRGLADQPGASNALRDALSGASGSTRPSIIFCACPDLSSRIPGEEELQLAQLEHAISPEMPKAASAPVTRLRVRPRDDGTALKRYR
jgi:hypothetical protein